MHQEFDHPHARAFELGMESPGGKPAILLIHGFTGSPAHMRPLGEFLAAQGFPVAGILLPGHGLTLWDMEKTDDALWLRAVRDAAAQLRTRFTRVIAGGLSMGGLLSLILGEEGMVDGILSFSAPIRIRNALAPLARWVWPVYRTIPWKPTAIRSGYLEAYDYGYPQTPVRKMPDLLRLMKRAERGLPDIDVPLLIMQSHRDETVRPVSAQILYGGAVHAPERKLIWLENSGHVITIGPERALVFGETLAFLHGL